MLIVDPHPDICETIEMGYRSEHIWRATCAAAADEATSVVLQDRPDAALIAAVLPGKSSGLQLARKLTSSVICCKASPPPAIASLSSVHIEGRQFVETH
jgi:DNA-binding response OmpR family regulator